jgi:hypothetical protein
MLALHAAPWSAAPSMATERAGHALVVLDRQAVLSCGGYNDADGTVASCELYHPQRGTWAPTGALAHPRYYLGMVRLKSGRVLACGGQEFNQAITACELYDPCTAQWRPAAAMIEARFRFVFVVLGDGTVLAAGGNTHLGAVTASSERYDPAADRWTSTGALPIAGAAQRAVLLGDGRVLAAGGEDPADRAMSAVSLFDPSTGQWSASPPLASARTAFDAVELDSGDVLIAGGADESSGALTDAKVFRVATQSWANAGTNLVDHFGPSMAKLENGQVLLAGGYVSGTVSGSSELYDPSTNGWTATGDMGVARFYGLAIVVPGLGPLFVGGQEQSTACLKSAEWFGVAPQADGGDISCVPPSPEAPREPRQHTVACGCRAAPGGALCALLLLCFRRRARRL